jgi:hypothetical protein
MRNATTFLATGLLLAFAGSALAATVDGTLEGAYGAPLATQATQTQFGDASISLIDYANGSELDAAYGYISGGVLYLFLAGNLESNFNKLELFLDTKAGGQNQMRADNPNVDFNGLNRLAGLKFDAAFSPDYYIGWSGGYDGSGYRLFANYAELLTTGGGVGNYLGSNTAATSGPLSGGTNPDGIEITINNSNAGGVGGGCASPALFPLVGTGAEYAIPLSALGSPTSGCIKVLAAVNGSGHDYFSNQFAAPLPAGTCNLGDPSFVDLSQIAGDQYFQICLQTVSARKSTWGNVKSLYR